MPVTRECLTLKMASVPERSGTLGCLHPVSAHGSGTRDPKQDHTMLSDFLLYIF